MKEDYKVLLKDSLNEDEAYLKLLPQPFSIDIAKEYAEKFNGEDFINEGAVKSVFLNKAKEHKIIHIATHAESDNLTPELSRLVFAKNLHDSLNINDNSLYSYEIYNFDLSSNLAVLTACETGRPALDPGEGMIFLAHAFNYAGSRNILTSLTEIDEMASSKIIASFYDNLEEGMTLSDALRAAKLNYLSNSRTPLNHPQYWSSLVLLGNGNEQLLSGNHYFLYASVVLLCMVSLFLLWFFGRSRKPRK